MKKTIALLLCLPMALSLFVACGKPNVTPDTESTSTETTVTTTTATTTTETTTTTTTTTEATTTTTTAETTTLPEIPTEPVKAPVLYFSFDNVSGSTVEDESGNGHNGKVAGQLTTVSGQNGNAVSFTALGQHITVDDAADLNFSNAESFTLDVWFQWSGTTKGSNWPCVVQKGLLISANAYKYVGYWINSGTGCLNLGITNVGENGCRNLPASAAAGKTWHHAIAVQNVENGTLNYYLDGALQHTTTPINASSVGYPITIGYNGNDGQFIGAVDELKIYDYAIDESKFNAKIPGVDGMDRGEYTYKDSNGASVTLPFRVYYPSDYTEANADKYPMLLFMHGYGECGTDNNKQIRVLGGANELLDKLIAKDNCIILAPQCFDPAMYNWVPLNHVWSTGSRELTAEPTISLAAATSLLNQFIDGGKVDTNRVYIAGLSMGGYGTWEMLARNPKLFAAAIPVCGSGIPSKASELTDVAIWAFHGLVDPTVPVSGTKDMEAAIKAAGGTKIKATYYSGVGHNCWIPAFGEAGLVDWLLAQSK